MRFRVMADETPVALWMCDTERRCTYVNRAWLSFTGRAFDDELCDGSFLERLEPRHGEPGFGRVVDAGDEEEFAQVAAFEGCNLNGKFHDQSVPWGLPSPQARGRVLPPRRTPVRPYLLN